MSGRTITRAALPAILVILTGCTAGQGEPERAATTTSVSSRTVEGSATSTPVVESSAPAEERVEAIEISSPPQIVANYPYAGTIDVVDECLVFRTLDGVNTYAIGLSSLHNRLVENGEILIPLHRVTPGAQVKFRVAGHVVPPSEIVSDPPTGCPDAVLAISQVALHEDQPLVPTQFARIEKCAHVLTGDGDGCVLTVVYRGSRWLADEAAEVEQTDLVMGADRVDGVPAGWAIWETDRSNAVVLQFESDPATRIVLERQP